MVKVKHLRGYIPTRGVDKIIRANEFRMGMNIKDDPNSKGSGWRRDSNTRKVLKARITLATTSMEKKMKEEKGIL